MPVFTLDEHNDPYTTSRLGWWKLDGDATDSSGNGHNLDVVDISYVANMNGVGRAASYNGSTSSCTVNNDFISLGHLWFHFWMNCATFGTVFTVCGNLLGSNGFRLRFNSTNWILFFSSASGSSTMTNTHGLSTSTWYHISVLFDYIHIRTLYFVNGVYVNVNSTPSLYWTIPTAKFVVGNVPFNGYLSDVRVHNNYSDDSTNIAHSIYKYIG
jgi:hypothetical protein